MNGPELAEATRARLEAQVPSRTVYVGSPPPTAPPRYFIIRVSEGSEESTRASRTINVQTPALWVMSVSRNADPSKAEDECRWGAARARAELRNWKPEGTWALRSEASKAASRNESLPNTTFEAVEQFSQRSNI